jgi:hypothetical protein
MGSQRRGEARHRFDHVPAVSLVLQCACPSALCALQVHQHAGYDADDPEYGNEGSHSVRWIGGSDQTKRTWMRNAAVARLPASTPPRKPNQSAAPRTGVR